MGNGLEQHEGLVAAVLGLGSAAIAAAARIFTGRKSVRRELEEHMAQDESALNLIDLKLGNIEKSQQRIEHTLELKFTEFHERLLGKGL